MGFGSWVWVFFFFLVAAFGACGDLDDLENYYGRDVYGVNSNRGVFHSRGFINYMLGRIRPLSTMPGFPSI